jgi:dolichol-phosphate mannosyltransferase
MIRKNTDAVIAVVIPCYRVTHHILNVIGAIGPEVSHIFVVDDKCPDKSGTLVQENSGDERVRVLYHEVNKGVGGAVVTGYRAAMAAGAHIVVKIDGDGQMDPCLIPLFVSPIVRMEADYCKGNRFQTVYGFRQMPRTRIFGNAILSFMTKLSSGYWNIFDPTNGYTAIHVLALRSLKLEHLSQRFFFESDVLMALGAIRAVVTDVPMEAVYGDEISGLKIRRIVFEFIGNHLYALLRRIIYFYYLRDFNLASLNLLLGLPMTIFGFVFGAVHWWQSIDTGAVASTGTVMIAVLPIVLGFQMILFFLGYDINNEPKHPLVRQQVVPRPLTSAVIIQELEKQVSTMHRSDGTIR